MSVTSRMPATGASRRASARVSAALRLRDQQLADCTQRLEAAQQNAEDLAVRAQFGNYARAIRRAQF